MQERVRVVAVIAANPALSSILAMMLAADSRLRVRQFETQLALEVYMRLAPVDLVVADFDCIAAPADQLALDLRALPGRESLAFEVIALSQKATPAIRDAASRAGIGEVILKPMSPRYLLDRVQARLLPTSLRPMRERRSVPRPAMPQPVYTADNVVQLFPAT